MLEEQNVIPLYRQLMEQIEEKIRQGVYRPGEQLMTEIEMSKAFGVSYGAESSERIGGKGACGEAAGKGNLCCKEEIQQESFTDIEFYTNVPFGGCYSRR